MKAVILSIPGAEIIPIGKAVVRLRTQYGLHVDARMLRTRISHELILGFKDDFTWFVEWHSVENYFAPLIEGMQAKGQAGHQGTKDS